MFRGEERSVMNSIHQKDGTRKEKLTIFLHQLSTFYLAPQFVVSAFSQLLDMEYLESDSPRGSLKLKLNTFFASKLIPDLIPEPRDIVL